MPRGPGKKSNYNLDYSRFDGAGYAKIDGGEEVAEGEEMPEDFKVALKNMPPELQEAYRLVTCLLFDERLFCLMLF